MINGQIVSSCVRSENGFLVTGVLESSRVNKLPPEIVTSLAESLVAGFRLVECISQDI